MQNRKKVIQKEIQTSRKVANKSFNLQNSTKNAKKRTNDLLKSNTPKFADVNIEKEIFSNPTPTKNKSRSRSNSYSRELGEIEETEEKASPDFKINISNKSKIFCKDSNKILCKDSNKSLKMDQIEEDKFFENTNKESAFIEVVENEISVHNSFSKDPNTVTCKQMKFISIASKINEEQHQLAIQLQLNEKIAENQRLQTNNNYLKQQMETYEKMLSKMNLEYEKILNDSIFKVSFKN